MFRTMLERLKREEAVMIRGIYTQGQADQMRDYLRVAEAKLGKPLSALWAGTLEPQTSLNDEGEEVPAYDSKGKRAVKRGMQVLVEVVR